MAPSATTLAAREREVRSVLYQLNHEVDQLPELTIRRLAPVLRVAQQELEKDLRAWLSRPNGAERFTAQEFRVALLQVDRAIARVKKAVPELRSALRSGARRAADVAEAHLRREAAYFSVRFGKSLAPIPILEAGKVVDGTLLDRFAKVSGEWPANVLAQIRRRLAISLVRRETVEQAQRRLVGRSAKYLSPLASPQQRAAVVSRVLWDQAEAQARRIVRTEIVNAYNRVKLDMIEELRAREGGWQKRWDGVLDGRICPNCRRLDDVVVPADKNFPGGVEAPPLHPACRCAVVSWRSDWDASGSRAKSA